MTLEIKKDLFWVGVVDWTLRDFHGYSLARKGTTYNSYLIRDRDTVLVDTVDSRFMPEFIDNLKGVVSLSDILYLVVCHVEPDHSGCLSKIIELTKPNKIFCSAQGKEFMISHFHQPNWPYEVVKQGDRIEIGNRTLRFIELTMLHWPDNMGCYIEEDKLLLSNDVFGHNWATSERFDDEVDFNELEWHLRHYFANIILPYSSIAMKLLDRIQKENLPIEMIAPSHGLIFRSHVEDVIKAYRKYASQMNKPKAVIVYDTMWGSTAKMAQKIAQGLLDEQISVRVFHMKTCHHSDVMAEVIDARAVIVGSPTHNKGVLPSISAMLRYMEGLAPKNKVGAIFGSYGWAAGAMSCMADALQRMEITLVDQVSVKNVPTAADMDRCVTLGRTLARAIWDKQ